MAACLSGSGAGTVGFDGECFFVKGFGDVAWLGSDELNKEFGKEIIEAFELYVKEHSIPKPWTETTYKRYEWDLCEILNHFGKVISHAKVQAQAAARAAVKRERERERAEQLALELAAEKLRRDALTPEERAAEDEAQRVEGLTRAQRTAEGFQRRVKAYRAECDARTAERDARSGRTTGRRKEAAGRRGYGGAAGGRGYGGAAGGRGKTTGRRDWDTVRR